MKRLIPFLFIIVTVNLFAVDKIIQSRHCQIVLAGTETQSVYIPYPSWKGMGYTQDFALDTSTVLDQSSVTVEKWASPSKLTIHIVTDSLSREESDSLAFRLRPLTYSVDKDSFYVAVNDTLWLVFDTRVTYTSTSLDYLNWTHARAYICKLTTELWGTCGVVLDCIQKAANTSGAATTLTIDAFFEF